MSTEPAAPRVLLLVPARTYRAADFLAAAGRLGLDLVVGSDGALPLGGRPVVHVSPGDPERSADLIMASTGPVAAVVAADSPMLTLAAVVAGRMGLAHNPVDAVIAAGDKAVQRRRWAAARVAQPAFRVVPAGAAKHALAQAAAEVGWPCVCSRALRFPGGMSLEEMVLARVLGRPVAGRRDGRPSGVLMLPVPRPGVLRAVEGRAEAAATPGVIALTITIPRGQRVRPLPEGDRYLGFIFAEGDTRDEVEQALGVARERLRLVIR